MVLSVVYFHCFFTLISFPCSGSSGRKSKDVHQDNEEDITDILTSEGEEGWLEKVLKKVKHKAMNHTESISTYRNVLTRRKTNN